MDAKTRATIKRASIQAQAQLKRFDKAAAKQLKKLYRQARDDIKRAIAAAESFDGTIHITNMARLLQQIDSRLQQLNDSRDALLGEQLRQAAESGVAPFAPLNGNLSALADEAIRQTVYFIAADGLQLSDRIWRLNQHQQAIIANSVTQAIIKGDGAARAAREFITQNLSVPPDLQRKIGAAQAHKIAAQTGKDLMAKGSPYSNALRLFRTEINRAHGEAYQAAAFDSPDVIGTKFLLSPNHPKADICDMHARVNRYGLGPGVYPQGKNPWPAHPNTLSFTVVVFKDEVTEADRKGKQTRIEWLRQQSPARQQQVLNSRKKRAALHQNLLKENQIGTSWQVLKKRYQKQGVDVDSLSMPAIQKVSHIIDPKKTVPQPAGVKISSIVDPLQHADLVDYITSQIDKVHGDGKLPIIPVRDVKSTQYLGYYQPGSSPHIGIVNWGNHKEMTAAHELGHFLDHHGLPGNGMSSLKSKQLADWRAAAFNSRSYQALESLYHNATDPDQVAHLKYLMKPEEVWARSYAQYIANKSGSKRMLQQLDAMRSNQGSLDIPRQWADDDFVAILKSIDDLFIKTGWIQ